MTISAIILTKNEEKNIKDCLSSVDWCDERIVIDDNSTDKTVEIARKHKTTVYEHTLENDFSQQRNFGLGKAQGEWVLFIDADERVSERLQNEILKLLQSKQVQTNSVDGFYIKREDTMWGKVLNHGEQGNTKLLRLAKRGAGKWSGKVHEIWHVTGKASLLENPLQHFPHPSLAEFLQEINFYSTLRAKELFEKGTTTNWFGIIAHTKGKFLQDYVAKLGFLDGIEGYIVALLMSLHAFLVRGKLWQLQNK